jgi:hypothetical protein
MQNRHPKNHCGKEKSRSFLHQCLFKGRETGDRRIRRDLAIERDIGRGFPSAGFWRSGFSEEQSNKLFPLLLASSGDEKY